MGKIKPNLIRHLGIIIFTLHLSWLQLWGLDPDKNIDQYLLDQWETSDDFPSNTINSIVQTPDGYLWLATSNGLVRFDGIKFSNIPFAKKEEISPSGPTEPITLLVNRAGVLWIGSTNGLTRFRDGQFKTFTTADGLTQNRVRCIAVDMKNNLWISFMTGYVDRFSNEIFTPFNASYGLEGDKINAVVENNSGNLLFASREKGVFSFREGRFSPYPVPGLENLNIITMYLDHDENLWIGTNKGLLRFNENDTTRYDSSHGLSHEYITVIKEDSEQNFWIGTLRGLNRLNKTNNGTIYFESLLHQAVIFCLYEDREKSLWIGTDNSGLKRLKNSKFTSFPVPQALEKEIIISIFRDRKNNTWLGSLGGKLFCFKENQLIKTITPLGVAGTGISAIADDSQGNLWLGTIGKGVFQKKNNTFVQLTSREGLTDNMVTSIYRDSHGNLWVGTFSGVSIIRSPGIEIETFTAREGLAGKVVHNVYEDKSGNIWITSDLGLTVLEQGKTKKQNIKYYLKGILAVSIYEDPSPPKEEGPIYWITTKSAGLKRLKLKDNTIYSYTTQQGMTTNTLYQFFEEQGYFWLMSNKGILRVSKKQLNLMAKGNTGKIDCISFGRADGLGSEEFHNELSRHSALQTKDGELWFITKKGISILNPGKMRVNKEPPPVVIEKVLFDGRALDLVPSQNSNEIKPNARRAMKSFDQTFSKVWPPAGQVEFRFTAPSFLSPEKISFKYQLVSHRGSTVIQNPARRAIKSFAGVQGAAFQKSPLAAGGKDRVACYRDLAPGTYTFSVTACNAEGIWNPKGASFTFTLEPLFYQTVGFKIAILILFVLLVTTVIYIYKKKRAVGKNSKDKKEIDKDKKENEEKEKYKRSNLTPEFAGECEKKLKHLMEVDKIYRDENISLQSLADKIPTKPYILSRVLNERMNRGFYDFINYYRLEEAKKILESPKKNHLKITVVGEDVGFNSTAAFYKAFKEYTGMTPNQYKKQSS
ncbi:MAG: two-component regulator propeller domain-containing protein [Candidatus Aminicenantes bacterium]|jgi:ligand-binding sensor domain-containing protein/AraC-like DNA-binding protein